MRMMKKNLVLFVILIFLSAGAALAACGGEAGSNGASNQQSSGDGDGDNQETAGDDEESSFDVTIEDESGESSSDSGKQANEEASEDSWGASINNGILSILLLSNNGVSISVIVETSEDLVAPGSFPVSQPPDGSHVVLLDLSVGDAFDSDTTGSIVLENCPSTVGDKVVGSFDNVVLESEMGDGTRTLNGSFDVSVYAVLGELHCEEVEEDADGDDEGTGDVENGNGGQCDWEFCDPEGACCPYAQCIGQCDHQCLFQDPDCNMGMNPVACSECIEDCYETDCNISSTCKSALEDGISCERQHGCDDPDFSEEQEEECIKEFCCDEAKAIY